MRWSKKIYTKHKNERSGSGESHPTCPSCPQAREVKVRKINDSICPTAQSKDIAVAPTSIKEVAELEDRRHNKPYGVERRDNLPQAAKQDGQVSGYAGWLGNSSDDRHPC
jgi:hypothetical protein